ncbi:hypothetical protein B0A48_03818 [Cryoendolithus antarcticus]|uniref:Methyltransferase type 11 domain-containing protein n=1 Tax=Cryoendolithus antarcticus TaxID=1507870 RepID=A0A1V8TH00_9PEZI|nr:hypothetical protein B0A48_03818 [Cryoendolithus antarcticus]
MPSAQRVALISENVTGPPGAEMLRLSDIASCEQVSILDNASGAGILVSHLIDLAANTPHLQLQRIVAGDVDPSALTYARERQEAHLTTNSSSAWSKVDIQKIDQHRIPFPDSSFTHVFANLGILFSPNDSKALSETYRVLQTDGTAGFTTWKGIKWWAELAKPAFAQYLPDAPALPAPEDVFPSPGWKDPNAILEKMDRAGFTEVKVTEFDFAPVVVPEEFCEATAVLVKLIAKRAWSEADFGLHAEKLEGAMLRYFREEFGEGKKEVRMTALITIGKKS